MRNSVYAGVAIVAAVSLAACGDSAADPILIPFAPVVLQADVNVQIGNTVVGSRPHYIVTTFVSATQAGAAATAYMDSVVLSYRLNDGPFVVGNALKQPQYSGDLAFMVQTGDRYTLYARLFAHASGKGGRSAIGTDDFSADGVAINAQ